MTPVEGSLSYHLPVPSDRCLTEVLGVEISALEKIVAEIASEIDRRTNLEEDLLYQLQYRELALDSELMQLRPSSTQHTPDSPRAIALEQDLVQVEFQKVRTKEATAKDLFELKKSLWHYWLLLKTKEVRRDFLQ